MSSGGLLKGKKLDLTAHDTIGAGGLALHTNVDSLTTDSSAGNGTQILSEATGLSALNLRWRSKAYYANGAAETSLLSGADLGALQQLAAAQDFTEKLA